MIFSRKNAGKWVASRKGKVIDSATKLPVLLKRIEKRQDRKDIWFDKIPPTAFAGNTTIRCISCESPINCPFFW
jgi:hypothetical protein